MTNFDYLCDKDAAQKIFDKNHFSDKKLGFKVIERGAIVPFVPVVEDGKRILEFGGLIDGNNRFIQSSVGKFGAGDVYTPTEEIRYVPATVVYLGLFYPVWGHFITEGLRYFWFLSSEIFKRNFADCPLAYVPYECKWYLDRMKNFRRLAELAAVDTDNLFPFVHPVRFENVILPDESFFTAEAGRYFTAEYRETIERIRDFALKNRTPTSSKKVYYFYGKNQTGEERLAEYFKSKGYDIVSPEKLTVDEQLNVLINADSFASTLGSCSHNSIFLRGGTEAIFIPRAANRFTAYQRLIDQAADLKAVYVDSSLSIFETFNGPYCFIISEQLKKFFGDNFDGYDSGDFKAFADYVKLAAKGGLKVNPAQVEGYGENFRDFMTQFRRRKDLTAKLPSGWDKSFLV